MIVVAIPAIALAVLSPAAFQGTWVWWLDCWPTSAQYVVGLAILGLVIMMSKWRKTGCGVLGVALVNLIAVLPLYISSLAEASGEAPSSPSTDHPRPPGL